MLQFSINMGHSGKRLAKTDAVDEVFKNRRATVSLGTLVCMKSQQYFTVANGRPTQRQKISRWILSRK